MQLSVRRIVLSLAAASAPLLYAQTSVLTYHNNPLRTGWNAAESVLTPASVASGRFGPIAKVSVDGQVDGSRWWLPIS